MNHKIAANRPCFGNKMTEKCPKPFLDEKNSTKTLLRQTCVFCVNSRTEICSFCVAFSDLKCAIFKRKFRISISDNDFVFTNESSLV